jgi:hypothetical protein
MKVLVKQACEIEGHTMGPDMRKKPGIFNVPAYLIFADLFVSLIKSEKISILDISEEEFKEENIPKKYHDVEPDPVVITIVEGILMSKEPKEDEDETTSDSSSDGDSSDSSDEGNQDSESESSEASDVEGSKELQASEGTEEKVSEVAEEVKRPSVDEARLKFLEAKIKRLSDKEKKELKALQAKLKG